VLTRGVSAQGIEAEIPLASGVGAEELERIARSPRTRGCAQVHKQIRNLNAVGLRVLPVRMWFGGVKNRPKLCGPVKS
jgi:hypothetical protein